MVENVKGTDAAQVKADSIGAEEGNRSSAVDTAKYRSSPDTIRVMLDTVGYSVKPDGAEIGRITNRLKRAQPSEVTPAELCEHVKQGKTFMCGAFEPKPSGRGWGAFLGQRLFGIDVDNKLGHMLLKPGMPGYLEPLDALERCREHGYFPLCLYFTMSANAETGAVKYRIVLDSGRVVADADKCAAAMRKLLSVFGEADASCVNPHTRLWLGGSGEVWPCYQLGREYWQGVGDYE